jgi:hypothetical protein
MASESPPTRRKFAHAWDEIKYLYSKLLYWLYEKQDRHHALRFCDRLEKLLQTASPDHQAILGEECWSLIYEAKDDLAKAIHYRESEIKQIKRLWEISIGTPSEDIALQGYGPSDLSDRYDLLAILYRDAGDLDKVISLLQESKQLCEAHGIRFDGKDLLRDYLAEKKQLHIPAESEAKKPKSRRRTASA